MEPRGEARTAPAATASISFRVRYFETDQMQVAHHAHYLVWFEAARTELCRTHGIDYGQMEQDGLFLPVLEARCRYRKPARYDDEVTVTVAVARRTRSTLQFAYTVSRAGEVLAEGETTQMLVDREGKPRTFSADLAARFDAAPGRLAGKAVRSGDDP